MATVTPPSRRPFNRAEADRRVRHPLQALRGTIRRYVVIEGLAVTVIFLSLWFWIGVAVDFGFFALLRFDWIRELDLNVSETVSFWIRAFLLVVLLGGLVAVVARKVVRRLFREFNDRALAMLLERRFPRELGDRLITAVEMADPKLSEKYGFSQIMLDQTIRDAADRVERLPVHEVFNWTRLKWHLVWAGLVSVGAYLLVGICWCVVAAIVASQADPNKPDKSVSGSPLNFFYRFNYVSSTWAEREVFLLGHRYWLGNEFLEFHRFPQGGELRVPRDEARPDVQIRAVKWILADRGSDAPEGWRALRWDDLAKHHLVEEELLAKVQVGDKFPGWMIDLDDLDPRVSGDVLPAEWGRQERSAGTLRQDVARRQAELLRKGGDFARTQAAQLELAEKGLLDWQHWTIDKLESQFGRLDVRQALRAASPPLDADGTCAAERAFTAVMSQLHSLAASPDMYGTLRRLEVPETINVYQTPVAGDPRKTPVSRRGYNKFLFVLDLKIVTESMRFYASGDEYSTATRQVTLVPPPSLTRLTIDAQEPAYLHYRLLGPDADQLQGQRQQLRGVAVGTDGPTTVIPVPAGTSLTVRASVNRDIKPGSARIVPPAKLGDKGARAPLTEAIETSGLRDLSVSFADVRRDIEFVFEFRDLDNVLGSRHVLIKQVPDRAPKLLGVAVNALLRPDFEAGTGKNPSKAGERLLITPDALIPFKGKIEDDRGLSRLQFKYVLRALPYQRLGDVAQEHKGEQPEPPEETDKALVVRTALSVGAFQYLPGTPGWQWSLAAHVATLGRLSKANEVFAGPKAETREMENARREFQNPKPDDVTFAQMKRLLQLQPRNRSEAAELITLGGDESQKQFVERLTASGQLEPLLRDLIHFLKLEKAERERLRPLIASEPQMVVKALVKAANASRAEATQTLDLLKKQPESLLVREYSLEQEAGFDVQAVLPGIKARGDQKQKHFQLDLYVLATDNNVETGPTTGPERGPFVFLIVSQDELVAEMVRQEKKLHGLLKAAVDEMDSARTETDTEVALRLTGGEEIKVDLLEARVGTEREKVQKLSGIARAVLDRYKHIRRELEVNRMTEGKKYRTVVEGIVGPLERLTDKTGGGIRTAEEVATQYLGLLEKDSTKLKNALAELRSAQREKKGDLEEKKNVEGARKQIEDHRQLYLAGNVRTSKTLTALSDKLREVLEAMQATIDADALLTSLIRIEARQRELDRLVQEELRLAIERLGNLEETPKTPKKK